MNNQKTMQDKYEAEFYEIEDYAMQNGLITKLIDDKFYIISDISYWKIIYIREWDCFFLYHGDTMPKNLDIQRYVDADYHFQKDVKQSDSILRLLYYIRRHDDFRAGLIEKVESMPRRTKKQKNEYRKMKAREENYNNAIVLQLISAVSMVNEMRAVV